MIPRSQGAGDAYLSTQTAAAVPLFLQSPCKGRCVSPQNSQPNFTVGICRRSLKARSWSIHLSFGLCSHLTGWHVPHLQEGLC